MDQPLAFSPDEPRVIPGGHDVFNLRHMKKGIPRDKIFVQSAESFDAGFRYSYTYWR